MFLIRNKLNQIERNFIPSKKCLELRPLKDHPTIPNHVFQNLNLLGLLDNLTQNNIYTENGKHFLKEHLFEIPTPLISKQDHEYIKQNRNTYKNILEKIKPLETKIMYLCEHNIEDLETVKSNVKFTLPFLNKLNNNKGILNIYNNYNIFNPVMSIISPIVMYIVSFFFFYKYLKYLAISVPQPGLFKDGMIRGLITIAMYLYTTYASTTCSFINQKIFKKMYESIQSVIEIRDLMNINNSTIDLKINETLYKKPFTLWNSNKGQIIHDFEHLIKSKNILETIIDSYKKLDAKLCLFELVESGHFCYAQKLNKTPNNRPIISAKDFYNPIIESNKNIKNTILLNGKNGLIISPNASGKSTILKSLALSTLCAQQLGIAPAKEFMYTPFKYIDTYLNLEDIDGKQSLYQNEVKRIKNYINVLKTMKQDEYSLFFIDEILSGTNSKDGSSASMAIAEKLASFNNSLALITTHHHQLASLHSYEKFHLKNYKLLKGVSLETNGLDILDLDKDIVSRARELKKKST